MNVMNVIVCLVMLVSEYTNGNSPNDRQIPRALINSDVNIHIDDQHRDMENKTRHRIEMQWERGRPINYLFLRKARR